jgi:ubiquinone/menaquinone biosynthesis C-methylase UbiE
MTDRSQDAGPGMTTWGLSCLSAEIRPYAERLVALANPAPAATVLNVACGTGTVTRLAAARLNAATRVAGIDQLPAMVDVAREVGEDLGLSIEWHVGDPTSLPFPDGTFDLAFCQQGLPFFRDRTAALAELHRCSPPAGEHISAPGGPAPTCRYGSGWHRSWTA